ncbi:MAG TPA: DUF4124 domain-containing protein [Rhodoferax sp.]
MIKMPSVAAALLVLAFANSDVAAQQQVFKCKDAAGKIEFTDYPCGGSRTGGRIPVEVNSLDFSAGRESQLRKENEQLRDQQRSAPSNGIASQRTQPDLQTQRIDSIACERAKRDYEVTASSTANSRAIVQSKRSMMYGTCGMKEPDQNTINIDTRVNNFVR